MEHHIHAAVLKVQRFHCAHTPSILVPRIHVETEERAPDFVASITGARVRHRLREMYAKPKEVNAVVPWLPDLEHLSIH